MKLDASRVAVRYRDDLTQEQSLSAASKADVSAVNASPTGVDRWWLLTLAAPLDDPRAVNREIQNLTALAEVEFASPVFVQPKGHWLIITSDVLMRLKLQERYRIAPVLAQVAPELRVVAKDFGGMPGAYQLRSSSPNGFAVLASANRLAADPRVVWAEPDALFTAQPGLIPNDFWFDECWGLMNTGQFGGEPDMDMVADLAWDVTTGNANVAVLVLDDGVDPGHPDINQLPGRDFTTGDPDGIPGGGPGNPCDNHGTTVAGCASAIINNTIGTVGIAPGCPTMSGRIAVNSVGVPCPRSGTIRESWVVNALRWGRDHGARVSNLSWEWTGPPWMALEDQYEETYLEGMVHFSAAGNGGPDGIGDPVISYPASIPVVNSVAALAPTGDRAIFSNYGPGLDFTAPGESIWTTDRTGGGGYDPFDDYVLMHGTSYASPYAAGVAGLILSHWINDLNHDLNARQVEWVMQCTARYLPDPPPAPPYENPIPYYNEDFGWGLVNANSALKFPTRRVSVSSTGQQGNGLSKNPSISADARFVAFASAASNLVPGDTNNTGDVFVHDRQTGTTQRVSVSSTGEQGNGSSADSSISGDARFLAFSSAASNLIPGDTNGGVDVFVHDRETGTTQRVSVSSSGEQGNARSENPSISADGRFVAFDSTANNLVPGDTNTFYDIFVHDRRWGTTERVSVSSTGEQAYGVSLYPSISPDGRFVAFESGAGNLVPGDTNHSSDVFVHDRETGTTQRVSVSSSGEQGNSYSRYPSISGDGRFVGFESEASNLVPGDTNGVIDVFVHDRETGTTERVSVSSTGEQGNLRSFLPSLSADGRFAGFHSYANNLVPGDTNGVWDIFVHDRQTDTTQRVSVSSTGEQGNGSSDHPSISADGRFVAFESRASNLVPRDWNGRGDVFVYQCAAPCVAPSISVQPVSQAVYVDDPVVLTVGADGSPPPSFQWRKDDVEISGAIFPSLRIARAACPDTGNYDVVVTNPCGSVTSTTATLTVTLPGDFDGDCDVDLSDFLYLLGCTGGPGASEGAGCESFDFDSDGDVDFADFGAFQVIFTGP